MAVGKKRPYEKKPDTSDIEKTLRDDAEKQFAHSMESSPTFKGQTTEQRIHELQVHPFQMQSGGLRMMTAEKPGKILMKKNVKVISKKSHTLIPSLVPPALLGDFQSLIESTRVRVATGVNAGLVMLHCHIGHRLLKSSWVQNRACTANGLLNG